MTPYDVHGKSPIAAWIPSRDDAGNGTTTLTDLVGGTNGALVGMDPETSWVEDSAAGGVRALEFVPDGSGNGVFAVNFAMDASLVYTLSMWFRGGPTQILNARLLEFYRTSSVRGGVLTRDVLRAYRLVGIVAGVETPQVYLDNQWRHCVASWGGGAMSLYVDGFLVDSCECDSFFQTGSDYTVSIGTYFAPNYTFTGRLDDIRIFSQALSTNEVAYLFNDGNGRGVLAGATPRRRRMMIRQQGMML